MPEENALPDDRVARTIASLDQAIAAAPKRDGYAFSDAVIQLSIVRDELAERDGRRTEDSRRRLTKLNAILSTILAGHFPLGDVPWDEVRNARGWLIEMQAAAEL